MKHPALFAIVVFLLAIGGVLTWRLSQQAPPPLAEVPLKPVSPSNAVVVSAPVPGSPPEPMAQRPGARREEVVGVGAILKARPDTGEIMIAGVVPNSPAAAAGLAGEFLVRKIDGVSTEGMTLRECVDRMRGPAGSRVRLELLRVEGNEPTTVELTRQRIQL